MPSEGDDVRARQIQALRRYVAELGTQRERPTQLGAQREDHKVEVGMRLPDVTVQRRRRPPLSWLLATVALVTAALLGGALLAAAAWSDDRPAGAGVGGITTAVSPTQSTGSGVALVASPECKMAADRANSVLAVAVRMRAALAQHTTVASGDPASFDRALAEYRQVVDQCILRAP
jgi:hypothetical protein